MPHFFFEQVDLLRVVSNTIGARVRTRWAECGIRGTGEPPAVRWDGYAARPRPARIAAVSTC